MERTYLSEVYDYFLSSISDYTILEAIANNPKDVEDELFTYFKKARGKFRKCKQSLDLGEDENGEKYFCSKEKYIVTSNDTLYSIADKYNIAPSKLAEINNMSILDKISTGDSLLVYKSVKLMDFEIDILTHLMLVEYMKPQLIATEVMKQSLSDKDFKIYSQANQLRELNLLYRLIQREAKTMITEYTYMGLTDK